MFKKIITFALVLALCAGMISAFALTSSADTYASGTGTEADPYIISTEAQLRALAEAVNGGANQAGVFFKLGADITLTSEWTPIGLFDDSPAEAENDIDTPFSGNFDGAGHKVEGLSITSTDKASVGLFGSLGENAVIKNVTVNGTITAHARFIGAVVGIGLLKGGRGINWCLLGKIAISWVVTPVIAAIICYFSLFFIQNVFAMEVYK